MLASPGFVYLSQNKFDQLGNVIYLGDSQCIPSYIRFNNKTKFQKRTHYTQYSIRNFCTINIWYMNLYYRFKQKIYQFIITYSDKKEFNKFKKENPELQYDTFDDILEIEKDYDNKEDFRSDFASRIQNMINY
jgi:hypothetical protein